MKKKIKSNDKTNQMDTLKTSRVFKVLGNYFVCECEGGMLVVVCVSMWVC